MLNRFTVFVVVAVVFSSCASAYRTGQTPDDVYYSPSSEVVVKRTYESDERRAKRYEEYLDRQDDNYVRMKVRNRNRWSSIDDYGYWNDSRYNYHCHCTCAPSYGFNYNSYGNTWYWNNPFYPVIFYKNPQIYTAQPSKSAVTAFQNPHFNNNNGYYNPKLGSVNGYSNSNTNSNGSIIRRVFTPSSSGTSTTNPSRTFEGRTPSSSAGGRSGGFNSSGSSSSTPRAPRN